MSNSGNKGIFSNNIGSSVGGFTKRNSTDAGSPDAGGSTTERRRVSPLEIALSPLCRPISQPFVAGYPDEVVPPSPHQPPMQFYSTLDQLHCHPRFFYLVMNNANTCTTHSPP